MSLNGVAVPAPVAGTVSGEAFHWIGPAVHLGAPWAANELVTEIVAVVGGGGGGADPPPPPNSAQPPAVAAKAAIVSRLAPRVVIDIDLSGMAFSLVGGSPVATRVRPVLERDRPGPQGALAHRARESRT